jgi:3-deoxy-D-manno-octulosonic-acid transferase
MILFYNLGIRLYCTLLFIISPFNKKAALFVRGRKNWRQRLKSAVKKNEKYLWFHCASLGEFEQGRPLIEGLKEQNPDQKVLLTFFSPSGYEVRKNYTGADYIFYLPLDTRRNAKRFLKIVKPQAAIFIKYEFLSDL